MFLETQCKYHNKQTHAPWCVPDGSNPLENPSLDASNSSNSRMSKTDNNETKTEISIPKVTFDASGNGSRSATKFNKDTIVNKKDSARVTNEAKNIEQKRIENFNKKYGTDF